MENSGKIHKNPLAVVATVTGMGLEGGGAGCVGDSSLDTFVKFEYFYQVCVCF